MAQKSDADLAAATASNPASEVACPKKKLRIVLVDDHVVVRQGLFGLFRAEPDMEVVGEASDGESAVYLIREIQPDFVLMDVSMPGMNGIQATRIIHSELPDVRIIGLSMFQTEELSAAMREAGAVDYVSKSAPSGNVIAAIRACA
jgi:DNA-binding NarL/FixJ family response regulator